MFQVLVLVAILSIVSGITRLNFTEHVHRATRRAEQEIMGVNTIHDMNNKCYCYHEYQLIVIKNEQEMLLLPRISAYCSFYLNRHRMLLISRIHMLLLSRIHRRCYCYQEYKLIVSVIKTIS